MRDHKQDVGLSTSDYMPEEEKVSATVPEEVKKKLADDVDEKIGELGGLASGFEPESLSEIV